MLGRLKYVQQRQEGLSLQPGGFEVEMASVLIRFSQEVRQYLIRFVNLLTLLD